MGTSETGEQRTGRRRQTIWYGAQTREEMTRIPISEAQLQATVVEMARLFGWLIHHDRPARRKDGSWSTPVQGNPGFPDLLLVRRGTVLAVELKSERGKLTAEQERWLAELGGAGVRAEVWRPEDLRSGRIERVLRGLEVSDGGGDADDRDPRHSDTGSPKAPGMLTASPNAGTQPTTRRRR